MENLKQAYKTERSHGFRAVHALNNAKTRLAWEKLKSANQNTVRLNIVPMDEYHDASYIDTWTDISETHRERIKSDIYARVNQHGLWGIVGEYWDGEEWQQADSCYDFIGDEWKNSGYDTDIMAATIDAYNNLTHCPTCGMPNNLTHCPTCGMPNNEITL